MTPKLTAEGTARDVVRIAQRARRDARRAVTDRITLTIGADGPVADAVRQHAEFIAGETLAVSVTVVPVAGVIAPAQPGRGRRQRQGARRSRALISVPPVSSVGSW